MKNAILCLVTILHQSNTSDWPAGMYFIRVAFMIESVAEGKIMVIYD